jgi:hypothetical protein
VATSQSMPPSSFSSFARPETFFGLQTGMSRREAEELLRFLVSAWRGQFRQAPATLSSDLRLLERVFDPAAQGARLREQIASLEDLPTPIPNLPAEIFLPVGTNRGLVTPEGRVAIECLDRKLTPADGQIVIALEDIAWANRVVADTYRSWGRKRLLDAIRPRRAVPIPTIAFALALLINGSVGPDRALPIATEHVKEEELSRLLGTVVDAFVRQLRPKRRQSEDFRLRGGWIITESTRNLFSLVKNERRRIWITEAGAVELPIRLGRELARQRGIDRVTARAAVDRLIDTYHQVRPQLVSFGLAHERPRRTTQIRDEFLASLSRDE